MVTERGSRDQSRGAETLGFVLILAGVLFSAWQWFDIDVGAFAWPFFVIVPGALMLVAGLLTGSRDGGALLPIGSAVTTAGLILLFQSYTELWATWAYVWALIPASVGLGLVVHGLLHGSGESVRTGSRLLATMLIVFAGAAFFFEVIVGLSGFGLRFAWAARYWPLLLIAAGVLLLGRNLIQDNRG